MTKQRKGLRAQFRRQTRFSASSPLDLVETIVSAMRHLSLARELLKVAGARRSLDRVRGALKSVDGARRHAKCLATRKESSYAE